MAGINQVASKVGNLANQVSKLSPSSALKTGEQSGENKLSFSDVLNQTIQQSEDLNKKSNYDTLELLSGNTNNLSDVMVDSQKSEIALNLTIAIRNKAMDAYKEIMNMQV